MTGPGAPARRYYVLWFGAMKNLVSASGYILFGSAFAFGDYKTILEGAALPFADRMHPPRRIPVSRVPLGGREKRRSAAGQRTESPLPSFRTRPAPCNDDRTILSASALLSPVPAAALFSFIGHLFPAIGAWGMLLGSSATGGESLRGTSHEAAPGGSRRPSLFSRWLRSDPESRVRLARSSSHAPANDSDAR